MGLATSTIGDLEQRIREEELLTKLFSFYYKEVVEANIVAKTLLERFGDLGEIFYTDKYKLSVMMPEEKRVLEVLELLKQLISDILRTRIKNTNVISNRKELLDYLKFTMGGLDVEQCRLLLLNKKNIVLVDEVVSEGSLDVAPLYLREIIKKVLFYGAVAIIVVHNHPSGSPVPSENDWIITDKIIKACKVFDVSVHDHIIVTKDSYFSILT
ncbi:DNA repair protein RadC [Candidatus Megaera polyxenophila]|jgi:DNA repair protein RadC|nr:DNA repair protein RadC [Candidatus Megaera polyxenophila]